MTNRDRLIELLNVDMSGCDGDYATEMADYLIANGVICPPCKVGDSVFTTYHGCLSVYKVTEFIINDFLWAKLYNPDYSGEYATKLVCLDFSFNEFVFLTREEAEKALKESEERNG